MLWDVSAVVGGESWFSLPALAIATGDADWVAEPWGNLLGLCGMFFGGVMLGAATGKPLTWILWTVHAAQAEGVDTAR